MPRPRRRRVIVGDELGARFDVDELSAGVLGVREDAARRSSSDPWKPPPSHCGAARHENRAPAPLERADGIGAVDQVETHFDEIGERRGIARAAQLLHRSSRDGGAQ